MAIKRYISTDLVEQPWYIEAEPRIKSLWIHLLLTCDIAGAFKPLPKMLSAYVGEDITMADIEEKLGGRVVKWKDRYLIPDFVRRQYYSSKASRLSPTCKQHAYVLARLAELGLTEEKLDELSNRDAQMTLGLELPKPPPKQAKPKFVPPTLEEVRAYFREKGTSISPDEFWSHYESVGWVQGKARTPIKNWKACLTTWEQFRKRNPDARSSGSPVKNVMTANSGSRRRFGDGA